MVTIIGRKEPERDQSRVYVKNGSLSYSRKIDALPIIATINPSDYALIQEGNQADVAISMAQQFSGLKFFDMLRESVISGTPLATSVISGTPLATQKRLIQHLINVNSAIKGEGVLYDAKGDLIEGDKLVQYAEGLYYNRWAYLNGRFPKNAKGEGHKGLDFVVMGADGKETRVPLMPCLENGCYAELGSMNEQGLLTRKDSVQKYNPGENIYFYPPVLRTDKPEEGFVARLNANPDNASVNCGGLPDIPNASLGGIPCAEGASPEKSVRK